MELSTVLAKAWAAPWRPDIKAGGSWWFAPRACHRFAFMR
jgi:hypothetical protein